MKVLFICSGNAYRSPLAEALLKKMRPDLQVDSAGTNAETMISREARRYSAKQNARQYLKKTPESLETKQLDDYDLIIAMEQIHKNIILAKYPECRDKITVWNIEDLGFRPYEYVEEINKQIEEKIWKLAKSL
jgi:protein-tyrosine-phosphatase